MRNADASDSVFSRVRRVFDTISRTAQGVGRNPGSVRLIAVTKTVTIDKIQQALEAGVRCIGENRLQEALPKVAALGAQWGELRWHFIGKIQRRKIKTLVGMFDMIQSVESLKLASDIDRHAESAGIEQKVLLEVNVAGEASKAGFSPADLEAVVPALDRLPHLRVEGLMAIPPFDADPEASRPYFRKLRYLADTLSRMPLERVCMKELSMGMSRDYEIAIQEGATMVRVGTAIFGERDA